MRRLTIFAAYAGLLAVALAADPAPDTADNDTPRSEPDVERILLIDPRAGIPAVFERHCQTYTELAEGDKLRLTVRHLWEPSKRLYYDAVQCVVPVDADGEKNGEERIYNRYGYSLERTVSWRHGVRHGPEKTMAVENRTRFARSEVPWVDGVVHGMKRAYHGNGQVMTEVQYVQGKPTGNATSYDSEGRVIQVAVYRDGVRHGVMTDYWPDTQTPKRTVPYEHGVINGIVREFHRNGNKRRERPFRDDLLHGEERQYDLAGKLTQTLYWKHGDAVTRDALTD